MLCRIASYLQCSGPAVVDLKEEKKVDLKEEKKEEKKVECKLNLNILRTRRVERRPKAAMKCSMSVS